MKTVGLLWGGKGQW